MMEAMKYEKRIEEAYTHFAAWYLDERGWGDLPQGRRPIGPCRIRICSRAVMRGRPCLQPGGLGTNPELAKGTYGW